MESVSNQIGYLILKDDGAVLESGGDLQNDEKSAKVIIELINLTESVDETFIPNSSCEQISLVYDNHCYNICMSNRRIYIVKLRNMNIREGIMTDSGVFAESESVIVPTATITNSSNLANTTVLT